MRTSGKSLGFFTLLLFILWLPKHSADPDQLTAPRIINAAYGGSVTVSCHYDPQFRDNTKYWCKGPIYELCKIVVKTPKKRHSDRCSIADDKEAGAFTVTMSSIRRSDQDMYWCVLARPGRNIFTGVKLIVSNKVIAATSTTPTNSLETNEQDNIRWWKPLRWIIFSSMVFSLISVHIAAWRIKAAHRIWHSNVPQHNSNIYG
ncbi:CMRF35-like molecule 1 isoform X2 [Dunckerocampus dactyliophorus]|uniref:CMRF35-like molecule 1 isoform X2 n=1 Tax=Dunckerocampus dactyliophorus TaxID=161453 RepID=UPI0024064D0D|nr:CMRF35-like molecule 1 isoform X2 [Dunckerocampus dactyliophorus]